MNAGRDVERLIADWLIEEAVLDAPDRILEGTSRAVQRTKQRRFGVAWRHNLMSTPFRFVAAACLGLILVGGALIVLRPGSPAMGGPSPSLLSPSPSPAATEACDLVTADEVERLAGNLGTGALPTRSGSGRETSCRYADGGLNLVLSLDFTSVGGTAAFDRARAATGVAPVDGAWDAAVFDPATSTLYVRKGDALVSISPTAIFQSPDRRLAIATAIGEVAVGRIPTSP